MILRKSLFVTILILMGCFHGNGESNTKTNVILVTLDTVRADHLGCYGYKDIKTPALDWLANKGILFENAITSSPITLPAHASILTGLYPCHNNVRNNGNYRLADNSITLATLLKKNGYFTAAFTSSMVLSSMYNLNQGFDEYDEKLDFHKSEWGGYNERRAGSVTRSALEWLSANKDYPYFAWIHYYDPHVTYEPPEPWLTTYKTHPYDGEIAYVDAQLSNVFWFAKEEEKAGKKVLIIVVGDHGEGLWEHGEPEHGTFLYQETLQIPLIFAWLPQTNKSQRIPQLVRTVDVLPTILDYLSLPIPNNLDGTTLRPFIEQKKKWPNFYAYSETLASRESYGWSELFSIQDSSWKFILAPKPELYDLKNDNKEKKNLSGSYADISKELMKQLTLLPYHIKKQAQKNMVTLSPEEKQKLASLGYAGQPRSDKKNLPDPKDKLQVIKSMDMVHTLFSKGQIQESIPIILNVLKDNENNRYMLLFLMEAYQLENKFQEAFKYAEKDLQLGDESGFMHFYVGLMYETAGDIKNAELYYHKSIEINPYYSSPLYKLALLAYQQKKFNLTKDYLFKMLKLKAQNADVYYLLGGIEAQQNDLTSAIEHFKKAVELDPLHLDALQKLSQAYHLEKRFKDAIDMYEKAIKIQPKDANLYLNIASIYYQDMNDKVNALPYFKKVLEIEPNHPDKLMITKIIAEIEKDH